MVGEAIVVVDQTSPLPLIAQIFSAVVLLIATLSWGAGATSFGSLADLVPNWTFTVAASVIALIFSSMALIFMKAKPDLYFKQIFVLPVVGPVLVGSLFSVFLLIWWTISSLVITFDGPFTVTTNGYFAAWGGFIGGVMGIGIGVGAQHARPHICLVASSVVVILAVIDPIDKGLYEGESICALIVSILTLILMIVLFVLGRLGQPVPDKVQLGLFVAVAIMWVVAACVVTFRGPFLVTGNGYFGVWIATICSAMALSSLMTDTMGDKIQSFKERVVPIS